MKNDYFYDEYIQLYGTLNEKKNLEYIDSLYDKKNDFCVRPTILLHRLFNSDFFNFDHKEFSVRDVISMLLLHHSFITVPQFEFLNLYPSNRTIAVRISKFQQGNKLMVDLEKSFDNHYKVYSLVDELRPSLCFTLPERYVEEMKLYEKAKYNTDSPSFLHDVLLLNNYYYLLGEFSFPTFSWYTKPYLPYYGINLNVIINSIEGYTKANDSNQSMRPDAALIFNDFSTKKIIYVEEDMCTERKPLIQKKIERYYNVMRRHSENVLVESILFSIYNECKVSYHTFSEDDKNSIPFSYFKALQLCKTLKEYSIKHEIESLCHIQNEIKSDIVRLDDEMMMEIDMRIIKKKKKRMNDLQLCLELIAKTKQYDDRNDRLEDCIEVINDIRSQQEYMRRENKESINYKVIRKRYRTIMDAIKETDGFSNLLLQGLSVYVVDTMFPMHLKFAMLSSFRSYETVYASYMKYRYKIRVKDYDNLSYKECSFFQYNGRKFLLKNVLITKNMEDVKPIAIENISHDIGAYFRVKRYLSSNETVRKCPLNLILMVHEIEDAIKLYEELELSKYYIPREPNKSFCATYITFCDYSKIDLRNPFFVLDPEHNKVEI